ncbi:hypothetical protein D917_00281 [Trichinella nativa]|uniref:Uncharacterized protein n=1 Tax=Trichinella nativa TaxID=6335 RepID=A0A1Y3EG85_9BILA|nr:hypothetical protein D917_00281 [Trichinella nativa]
MVVKLIQIKCNEEIMYKNLHTMTIAVDIMNVVFGQLAFLSNAIFVIISSMKKEKKKMDQLTIVLAVHWLDLDFHLNVTNA